MLARMTCQYTKFITVMHKTVRSSSQINSEHASSTIFIQCSISSGKKIQRAAGFDFFSEAKKPQRGNCK